MDKKKLEALEVAIGQIDREFGGGTIMRLGVDSGASAVASIPTGSLTLDLALGIGGIPQGLSYSELNRRVNQPWPIT